MAVKAPIDWHHVPFPWQTDAWRQLNDWLTAGRLPHAIMLSDAADSRSDLFATAFAARLLCRQPADNRACGECPSCRQFSAGAHPDYHAVTILEDKIGIGVDQVRALARALALTSQYGQGKVALLYPADAMNANAANSLLKTLEEPTPGTWLILVTAQPARLPATLRSRCQRLSLHAHDAAAALAWLNAQEPRSDWPVLLAIAGGAPLLALELSGMPLMQRRLDFFRQLLDLRTRRGDPLKCAGDLGGDSLGVALRLLQLWVADLVILASTRGSSEAPLANADARALLQTGLEGLNLRQLHAYLDHIGQAVKLESAPVNTQLMLEQLLIEWADGLASLAAAPLAALTG
ncbi:MAG: DNA polymerase III subunit delta' [Rhizomicrobium sp.]